MSRILGFSLIAICYTHLNAFGQNDDPSKYPVEPQVAEASDEGQTAITSFKIPEGWRCELFAAEPDVANPVAFYVDYSGRVFVCETYRQNNGVTDNRGHDQEWLKADLAAQTVQDRIDYHRRLSSDGGRNFEKYDDRIKLLIDKDQDGKVDESIVFANHFHQLEEGTGAGVLVRGNTAFYTCIPKLWKLTDSDGDGQAEGRSVLSDGYGVRVAFRGHDMHGLVIGPDGRLYFSIGDRGYHVQTESGLLADPASGAVFRCELDGSQLEVFATGLRNPQELAFDDWGRLFTGDNNSDSGDKARWVYVVRGGDTGWRMHYQYHPTRGPFNPESIWKPFSQETPAYIVPPVDNIADGPSGLTYYPGVGLGPEFANTFFLVDFRGQASNSGIRAVKVKEKGAFFEIDSNEPLIWNILATDCDFGPDGTLYVSDWVNGWNGEGKGRIYRFFDPQGKESSAERTSASWLQKSFHELTVEQLQQAIQDPDRRVRFEAQWELAAQEKVAALSQIASNSHREERLRLHGVWGLGQIARSKKSKSVEAQRSLLGLLEDKNPSVVSVAIQALAESNATELQENLVKLLRSDHPRVRFEACMAVGHFGMEEALGGVAQVLVENQNSDPIIRHGAIMALAGQKQRDRIVELSSHPISAVRLAAVVALRKRLDSRLAVFLDDLDPKVATEAARAIYDLPELHSELPRLANSLKKSTSSAAWLKRAMNAHFRLGKQENALAIAILAGDPKLSEATRVEAIEMLAQWSKPIPMDRVTYELLPLEERPESIAKEAMTRQLAGMASAPNRVRAKALEVASKLGIVEVVPLLIKVLDDLNSPSEHRAAALTGLVSLTRKDALTRVFQLCNDSSPAVRIAAVRALAELDANQSLPALRKAIHSASSLERQSAWDVVKTIDPELARPLLEEGATRYLDGSLEKDCRLNVFEAVQERLSGPLAEKVRSDAARRRSSVATDPIQAYADCLEGGAFSAGRELFFNRSQLSCVRCHKVADRGGEVGPVLTDLGAKKDRSYLLEAIVAPNSKIAEGFQSTVVVTDDDQIYTGIIKKEDDEFLHILNAEGLTITVEANTIVTRKPGLSSMPPDLVKYLTDRELRDLVAYLAGLDGKNPEALIGGVEGHAEK